MNEYNVINVITNLNKICICADLDKLYPLFFSQIIQKNCYNHKNYYNQKNH